MAQISENDNSHKKIEFKANSSEGVTGLNTDDSRVQPLAVAVERDVVKGDNTLEIFAEVADKTLEAVEEIPMTRWMDIAAPILKSGGKTVAVILALGFISIPLLLSGSPWVGLVLAIGASITAILSSP